MCVCIYIYVKKTLFSFFEGSSLKKKMCLCNKWCFILFVLFLLFIIMSMMRMKERACRNYYVDRFHICH